MCRFIFVLFVIPFALDVQAGDFAGGDGSPESPWQITEPEHLDNIRHHLSDHFELVGSIDLSGTVYSQGSGWLPIGSCSYGAGGCLDPGFTGLLDGNTHTIHGLYIDRQRADVGLFGSLQSGAVVTDLNLTGVNISVGGGGNDFVGALAGVAFDSEIFNVSVEGIVSGFNHAGGLIGQMTGGFGQDLHADVVVSGLDNTGGLIGVMNDGAYLEEAMINRSSATGEVSGRTSVGGLVGSTFSGALIMRSSAMGNVSSTSHQAGGLVGAMLTDSEAHYVRAGGKVESLENSAGGLIGWLNRGELSNCYATGKVRGDNSVGGLVGSQSVGSVLNCYAIGKVSFLGEEGNAIGGLIGGRTAGSVHQSFWDTEVSGTDLSDGGWGVTTAEMLTSETFSDVGWDFDDLPVWSIGDSGHGRSCPWLAEVPEYPPPCDGIFAAGFSALQD